MSKPSRLAFWALLCLPALTAAGSLQITGLERLGGAPDGGVRVRLLVDLSGAPEQALAHGVTLPLLIQWRRCVQGLCQPPAGAVHLQARYAPLQERYLLEHQDRPVRAFAFQPNLLDALENPPPVAVPAGDGWQLRVRLRVRHLPPPLRLPARLNAEWKLNSGWVALP